MAPDALLMLLVTTGSPAVFGLGVVWVMRGAYALMSSGGDESRTQEAVQTIEDGAWCAGLAATAWSLSQLIARLVAVGG